jgi:hypothetical protein
MIRSWALDALTPSVSWIVPEDCDLIQLATTSGFAVVSKDIAISSSEFETPTVNAYSENHIGFVSLQDFLQPFFTFAFPVQLRKGETVKISVSGAGNTMLIFADPVSAT